MGVETSSKVMVTYGKHVLTLTPREFNPAFALLLIVCRLDANYVRVLQPEGDTFLLSVPDGTWKYTLETQEDDAWRQPDFDDSSWLPMVEKPFAPLPPNYGGNLEDWTKDLTDQGAKGLGIDFTPSRLQQFKSQLGQNLSLPAAYVRKTFTVTQKRQEEKVNAS